MTDINVLTVTASELETKLNDNSITSRQLVKLYLSQIAKYNGYLKAVIAVAPEELLDKTAAKFDAERAAGNIRGPLHGIPILLKVLNSCPDIYIFNIDVILICAILPGQHRYRPGAGLAHHRRQSCARRLQTEKECRYC